MTLDLLDRRLLFVTGKGGVGKSTVAAGLALLAAERGKRTLVCEVDAKGALSDMFEVSTTDFTPREVQPRLFAMSMDTEESLKEYLSLQLKIPLVARIGPLARTFDFIANAAPGVKEILTVGKLCWEVRERHYDLVVVARLLCVLSRAFVGVCFRSTNPTRRRQTLRHRSLFCLRRLRLP